MWCGWIVSLCSFFLSERVIMLSLSLFMLFFLVVVGMWEDMLWYVLCSLGGVMVSVC